MADASAVLEYLFRTEAGNQVREVFRATNADLHVPALCDVEVAAGIRRAIAHDALTLARANEAIEDYLDLPLTRHGHTSLLVQILALRSNFTAYDACYVALAKHLDAELLTADLRLARATSEHTDVVVVADAHLD